LIDSLSRQEATVIVGADPRLGEFAMQYMAEQKHWPPRAELFTLSLPELLGLVESDKEDDLPKRVECLDSLRSILERYAQTDFAGMFEDG